MALPLTYDFINQIIEVPEPDVELTLQYLVDQTRDQEDNLSPPMGYSKIMDAFGKQPLGGGTFVGITVILLDNWRVRFEERLGPDTVSAIVAGGNLVAESGNPIAPSDYVTVTLAQSSSPTIATPSDNIDLKYLIASLYDTQKSVGDIYYWDPTNGSDSNDGTTPSTAVATFTAAQGLATEGNYDTIYCLANDPGGTTTVTETLSITKNTLKVRGPGHVFQLVPTADTADTIAITADNVEISGLYVSTAGTGSRDAINITGDYAYIKDAWITGVQGDGIDISSAQVTKIDTTVIEHTGGSGTGSGINIGDDTTQSIISKCIVFDHDDDGISLSGTGIADNVIENCLIYNNTEYGVDIGTGVARTTVRGGNTFNANTSGNTRDLGTNTYIETPAGGASVTDIADAVWDEVIADHTIAGTTGKTLKDAKTKATLASLK